jgi:hypothetical protein
MRRTRTPLVGVVTAILVLAALPAAFAAHHHGSAATCLRNQLSVRSNGSQGALGTIYGAWVFTNVSATPCSLDGYPTMQLYGRTGRPFTTTMKDDLTPGPQAVTLASGASATFRSSYSDVPSGSKCPISTVAQITAPNVTASLFIPAMLAPCGGIVHVSAVRPGIHHA